MNPAIAVKRARQGVGISQDELARRVGVTQGAIAHFETGRRKPGIDMMERIAAACQLSLVQVMRLGEEEASEEEVVAA